MSGCPAEFELATYLAGECTEERSREIAAHLERCEQCGSWVRAARQNDAWWEGARDQLSADRTDTSPGAAKTSVPPGDTRWPEIPGYEITRELSHGGQGVVYQALQAATRQLVAIKILREGPVASKSARLRFEREIQLVAQLRHPNIISVFHSSVTESGSPYYVMDYIRGRRLDQHVHENRMELRAALGLFGVICDAVQHAHHRGVIHRDLKPSNILVDASGVPKILDFGLAKWLAAPVEPGVSVTQQVIGTLPYMSPEQTRGNPDEIDARTDIYSLGVILYELLTGHYPYPVIGELAEVLRNIAQTPATPLMHNWDPASGISQDAARGFRVRRCPIPNDVETIVLRALAKQPARRYQSAGELARDLRHFLDGEPIEAKRDSFWYVARKIARRNLPQTIVAASILVILSSAATIAVDQLRVAASAEKARRESDQVLAREIADYDRMARITRWYLFSAFLLEWRSDCLEQARWIRDHRMLAGSAEHLAAGFLLDANATAERWLEAMPDDSRAIAFLALGEKQLKAGEYDAAKAAFEQAKHLLEDGPNGEAASTWWSTTISSRLREVQRRAALVAPD